MHDFYLYSINVRNENKDINISLKHLERILKYGYILTRESLGMTGWGFNGKSYISLADYDKRNDIAFDYYNAYELFSSRAISIMIDKNKVKAKVPRLVEPIEYSKLSHIRFILAAWGILDGLYSDLPDEVQVKGNIRSEAFRGITIPTLELFKQYDLDKVREIYKEIKILLATYQYEIGIYDVEGLEQISSGKDVERIIKRSF